MSAAYIIADYDERGRLYAVFDPNAHHVEPGVRSSRFAAFCSPFRSKEDAERALIEADAVISYESEWKAR